MPQSFYFQAVALYAVLGLTFVLQYLSGSNGSSTQVTDAKGVVWQTGDIYQTAALTSIYTMIFIAVLTTIKLLQGATRASESLVEGRLAGSRGGVAKRAP